MGAWIKVFNDGTREVGTDKLIRQNKASWSRGKLDDIKSVQIYENKISVHCSIEGTDWHQFDRFVSLLSKSGQQCNRVCRCIQAKVQQKHVGKYIIINRIEPIYFITLGDMKTNFKVTNKDIGKWFSFVLSYNGNLNVFISDKGRVK